MASLAAGANCFGAPAADLSATGMPAPMFRSPGERFGVAESSQALVEPDAGGHGPDPTWLAQGAFRAAQTLRELPAKRTFWKASVVALAAASAVDAHSSWGKREANPILANADGRFGGRAIAIKAAITGAALGMQWMLVKRGGPRATRVAAIGNTVMAGYYAHVAIHNYGVKR
jgi:hypothetical protein